MNSTLALSTFGGLVLLQDGIAIGGAGGQRRPLALLAILAVGADRGVSRDKIIGLLWPDSDVERGRRALAQTVYSLRKVTGRDDLITGVADLRLNRDVIEADTFRFTDALRSANPADAADIYRGVFCDGFVVPGAPDFERWLEGERTRLATECTRLLKKLADDARKSASVEREIEWTRRLVLIEPLDSRATVDYMDALEKGGDISGALRAARNHEVQLRDHLDLPLSAQIAERVARLSRVEPAKVLVRAAQEKTMENAPAIIADAPVAIKRPSARAGWLKIGAPLAFAAILVASIFALRSHGPAAAVAAAPPMRPDVVAILPFEVQSSDKALQFLGEGTADLIARWLSVSEKPRGIDPGTVISIMESMKPVVPTKDAAAIQARAREVARIAGAGEVMIGKVSGTAEMLSVSATIFDVKTGEERASTQVVGKLDSLSSLVESIATRMVAQTAVGVDRANAFSTARFAVLRSYLRAESAFHDDNYRDAVTLYEQSLAQDSTFAPAALGLAIASDRRNAAEQHDRGLALAWSARDKLGEYDRVYLEALAGPRYPDPSPISEQLSAWEKVVTMNPDRATAWVELGERFLYDGGFLGVRNANERAVSAFSKSLELDPEDPRGTRGLIVALVRENALPRLNALLRKTDLSRVGGDLTGYLRWRVAIARNDTAALRVVRMRLPSFTEPSLRAIAMSSQNERIAFPDGERAARLLSARALLASEQLDVLLAQHSFAMNEGKYTKALDITEQIEDAQPGSRAHLRLRVLDALYDGGDTIAAARAVREIEVSSASHPTDAEGRALRMADLCVLAQWYAAPWRPATPDRDLVKGMITEMRTASPATTTIPVAASPKGCADVAAAMLSVARGSSDARTRVRFLDNTMLAGPAMGDATVWATLATARLYEALGDSDRALVVVRQRAFMKGWPRYRAASLAEEAKLAKR